MRQLHRLPRPVYNAQPGVDFQVNGVQVTFYPTRTSLANLGLVGLPAGTRLDLDPPFTLGRPLMVNASWSPACSLSALRLDLATESHPAPLSIAGVSWRRAEAGRGPEWSLPSKARPGDRGFLTASQHSWSQPMRALLKGAERRLKTKRALPDATMAAHPAVPSAPARGRAFFQELDSHTNPNLSAPSYAIVVKQAVALTITLHDRLWARLSGGSPAALDPDLVKALSGEQLKVYRQIWTTGFAKQRAPGGEIPRAFVAFASGGYVKDPEDFRGQPDSANFFLFAEFALVAGDDATSGSKVPPADRQIWRELLPSLVGAQRAYVQAYRPPSGGLHWSGYSFNNRKSKGDADAGEWASDANAEIASLWKIVKEKSPAEAIAAAQQSSAATARLAFADDFPVAHPALSVSSAQYLRPEVRPVHYRGRPLLDWASRPPSAKASSTAAATPPAQGPASSSAKGPGRRGATPQADRPADSRARRGAGGRPASRRARKAR